MYAEKSRMSALRRIVLVLLALLSWAGAQTAQPSQLPPPTAIESDRPITKAEAKALFRSVDEILEFVSHDTGLPIHHKVKRRLITRDQVQKFVEQRIKTDQDAQRLERSQLVLKKFGMIPADYDLHAEFVKLLREQVAAYYDPKTKTVNLLDWVAPDLQRPVLAHELTHALQDQAVGLTQWLRAASKENGNLPDPEELVSEEAQAARENVSEGQAMLAMLDYTLAPAGLSVLKSPAAVDMMRAQMTEGADLPIVAAAPVYLRESLYMPYTFGLDFERAVLVKNGTTAAYSGTLEHPPADTLQVMLPNEYLENKPVAQLKVPDLDKLMGPDYERYDFGGIGAFDIYLMAKQYAPDKDAKEYYPHWRGGYYLAAHLKSAPQEQISLIFFSRWDSPESAQMFGKMYEDYVPQRYPLYKDFPVFPLNDEIGDEAAHFPGQNVLVQRHQSDLLIVETFDQAARVRISQALLPGFSLARW
jgi:hypothetical protein